MPLNTVYIVRHGYRSNWLPLAQQVPPPTGVDSDPSLAPHGVNQSLELAEYFKKIASNSNPPTSPQMIFSSPFYRCIETINPTAETLQLRVNIETGIGEWFKPNRGIIPIPVDNKTMNGFFNTVDDVWTNTLIPSPDGEREVDIFNRCKLFWEKFIPKLESEYPNVESIILVTHAATKIALGMSLLGYQNVREFLQPKDGGDGKTTRIGGSTCGVDIYQRKEHHEWNLIQNDKTDFLSLGSEMNWHFATSQFEAGSKEDIEYRQRLKREQEEANKRHGSAPPAEEKEKETEKEVEKETEKEVEKETEKEVEKKVEKEMEKEVAKETDKETPVKKTSSMQTEEEFEEFYVNVVFPPVTDPIHSSNSQYQNQQQNHYHHHQQQHHQNQQPNELQESIDYKNEAGVSSTINKLRISGLAEEKPLFQTKNSVLQGQWSKLVGSELIFDENGEYLATVDGHIELQHGRLVPKKVETGSLLERAKKLAKSVENTEKSGENSHKSSDQM